MRRKHNWLIPAVILGIAAAGAVTFSAYSVLDQRASPPSQPSVTKTLVAQRVAPPVSNTATRPPAAASVPGNTSVPRHAAARTPTPTVPPSATATVAPAVATMPESTPTSEHSPLVPPAPATATLPAPQDALLQGAQTLATAQTGTPPAANDPIVVAFTRDLTLIHAVCGVSTVTAVDTILRVTTTMRNAGAVAQTMQTADGLVALLVHGKKLEVSANAASICQGLFQSSAAGGISLVQHGAAQPQPTRAVTLKHPHKYKGDNGGNGGDQGNNGD